MWLNSFMSWIGGKKALRELIVTLFPVYYERYIEVFGGGGWVLFHKPPGNDFEVYNDFNSLLVNLYRCVRDKPQELMESLRYVLNARRISMRSARRWPVTAPPAMCRRPPGSISSSGTAMLRA